jgi:alkylhydroperoxidase family enzyme
VASGDIHKLRREGFSDAAIHDAAQVIAYFNYINRIADGLGVDRESWMPEKPAGGP